VRGWRLRLIVGICAAVSALGVYGGVQALL